MSRVHISVTPCEFRGGRNGIWVGFSWSVFHFPLSQISFPTCNDHSWGCLPQPWMKRSGEGILRMGDAVTSEEEDTNSQDLNIPTDHGHLAWNFFNENHTAGHKSLNHLSKYSWCHGLVASACCDQLKNARHFSIYFVYLSNCKTTPLSGSWKHPHTYGTKVKAYIFQGLSCLLQAVTKISTVGQFRENLDIGLKNKISM